MKILLCDFVGHAFPAELSRELAHRGTAVCHAHLGGVRRWQGSSRRPTE